MSFFNDLTLMPDDPILSLPALFTADPRTNKVNLGIGVYRTADGLPLVLTSVKKAENILLQKNLYKEYSAIEGEHELMKYSLPVLFGTDEKLLHSDRLFTTQTIGGSGALRIGGEFLAKEISKTVFLSQPSWSNHKLIFERAGLNVGSYPYLDLSKNKLDFSGMCHAIKNMPPGSIIVLHGCCHNPTGIDPSLEQWKEISNLILAQKVIPFFDIAYQGFGQDLDTDAAAIRLFANEGHEMLVAYSFSKNFGLYGERVGFLTTITDSPKNIPAIASQIKLAIRSNYSTPPLHGSRIISTILKSHELTLEWKSELTNMRDRVREMRKSLVAAMMVKSKDTDYSYINEQHGLFSLSGLSSEQVHRLRHEKALFMPSNGRINIAGLNTQNIEYVAEALLSVM